MHITKPVRLTARRHKCVLLSGVLACVLLRGVAAAQGLTGMLIGTVSDVQGAAIPGAVVRLGSPAMIGGPTTLTTDKRGQLRFMSLTPGLYDLDISMGGSTFDGRRSFRRYLEGAAHVSCRVASYSAHPVRVDAAGGNVPRFTTGRRARRTDHRLHWQGRNGEPARCP